MRTFGTVALVFTLIVAIVVFGVLICGVGALNQEAALRAEINAHLKTREVALDSMRKIISQKSQLPAAAKEDLLTLLPEIAEGRSGGQVFKSVVEGYPELNIDLYKDLSRSIEAERHVFQREQEVLFDVKREHDSLLNSVFGGAVCKMFGRKPINIKVISSTEAKEIVESGVEDDTNLKLNYNESREQSHTITCYEDDKNVQLANGDTLIIKLKSRLGTGYSWEQVITNNNSILKKNDSDNDKSETEKVHDSSYGPETSLVGYFEYQIFRFIADKKGIEVLEFQYRRPFEESGPKKRIKIDVKVS